MKRIQVILVMLVMTIASFANGNGERPIYEIHSMMVYNFMKYVNWPINATKGDFVIGVIGDDEVYNTLNQWYSGKKKGSQTIVIKNFNNPKEAEECQVVYMGKSKSNAFNELKSVLNGKSTLVITNKSGLGEKGSSINFKTVDGKLKFEMNQAAIEKANLQVSSQLRAIAILI